MKLIDKDALVAEIKRRINEINLDSIEDWRYRLQREHDIEVMKNILSLINTIETKEVDLEKEIAKYLGGDWKQDTPIEVQSDMIGYAKYFFELGMQAQFDKELVEEVYSHLDSIKDTADRMTSGNFMHNRAAIKFSANTIAKVLELMGLKAQKGK